ncbi:hypothetical protein HMPREF1077_02384 [Parabacteroides johnsonii CL02T12C29]|uniref:Uncharacterized protein n=1 Tax=Parabacteroides johnsonii CL02T12C29 TaxID=999419 RepID=K5Y7H8_9BACT|nr:hypothetical protein HMPREF1077_02384 [Parabacteroides johnsonii CL02T12C29]
MIHHITADRLVESATQAVTEELFHDFDNTLRTLCDEDDDRKAVFRTLRYARYYAAISRKRKRRRVVLKFVSCISSSDISTRSWRY